MPPIFYAALVPALALGLIHLLWLSERGTRSVGQHVGALGALLVAPIVIGVLYVGLRAAASVVPDELVTTLCLVVIALMAIVVIHLLWWGQRGEHASGSRHAIAIAVLALAPLAIAGLVSGLSAAAERLETWQIIVGCIALAGVLALIMIHVMWWADSRRTPGHNGLAHVIGLVSNGVLIGGAIALNLIFVFDSSAKTDEHPLRETQTIEASLAVKKTKMTQPQKKVKEPEPKDKPTGVSHDDKKKPIEDKKKPDEPKKKPDEPIDPKDLAKKFHHPQDDDDPTGKPVTNIGDFNGSEKGFATETKGDPYFQQLIADMGYNPPEIAKDEGTPVGCIHLAPDGKIPETKFFETTSGDYQTAAEAAIAQLKKTRNADPKPVPDNLLSVTTKWLCFKFTVKAQ